MKVFAHEFRYVHLECKGCDYVTDGRCMIYINPSMWFRHGRVCPCATHLKKAELTPLEKKRIGQQKSKKWRKKS